MWTLEVLFITLAVPKVSLLTLAVLYKHYILLLTSSDWAKTEYSLQVPWRLRLYCHQNM